MFRYLAATMRYLSAFFVIFGPSIHRCNPFPTPSPTTLPLWWIGILARVRERWHIERSWSIYNQCASADENYKIYDPALRRRSGSKYPKFICILRKMVQWKQNGSTKTGPMISNQESVGQGRIFRNILNDNLSQKNWRELYRQHVSLESRPLGKHRKRQDTR